MGHVVDHGVHAAAPGPEKDPGPHAAHALVVCTAPVVDAGPARKVPAGQLAHVLSDTAVPGARKYLPGKHKGEYSVQASALAPEKLPGAHAVQMLAPPVAGA